MALTCTPQALAPAAACFECLTPKQQQTVQTYLLAQLALNSGAVNTADPKTLLSRAACFSCLTTEEQKLVQLYLECQLANK